MIFHKRRTFGWRFWILFILSLVLIVCDRKQLVLPRAKPYLQMATIPLDYIVVLPEHTYRSVRDYFVLQHELVHDKKNWQDQKIILQAQLQQLSSLKIQNQELQSLLKTQPVEQDQKYLMAKVTSIKSEGTAREILINRGSHSGIKTGQAIVAADGIIGQIIEVTPLNSRVMLLSDARSAIPVINQRTHENLIVVGNGNNSDLELLNVTNNADIKIGDVLLSSGLGGHYPGGYIVGNVSQIDLKGKNVSKVHVKPQASFDRAHQVLIVFVDDKDVVQSSGGDES